jgi:3D (Asp-Asp-Asp) domain-containing protein
MRKVITILLLIVICLLSISASAEGLRYPEVFENSDIQWHKMATTAYMIHGTTATGGTTHPGIAAADPYLGMVAMIYSMDGEFLGMYEVTDTGGTEAIRQGKVIDVWFPDLEQCKEWMRKTEGKCMVYFIDGN